MKITQKSRDNGLLEYKDLEIGEIYYATGGGKTSFDGGLYMMLDNGNLVDIINGTWYDYSQSWLYRKADVELVEYSRFDDK